MRGKAFASVLLLYLKSFRRARGFLIFLSNFIDDRKNQKNKKKAQKNAENLLTKKGKCDTIDAPLWTELFLCAPKCAKSDVFGSGQAGLVRYIEGGTRGFVWVSLQSLIFLNGRCRTKWPMKQELRLRSYAPNASSAITTRKRTRRMTLTDWK